MQGVRGSTTVCGVDWKRCENWWLRKRDVMLKIVDENSEVNFDHQSIRRKSRRMALLKSREKTEKENARDIWGIAKARAEGHALFIHEVRGRCICPFGTTDTCRFPESLLLVYR